VQDQGKNWHRSSIVAVTFGVSGIAGPSD